MSNRSSPAHTNVWVDLRAFLLGSGRRGLLLLSVESLIAALLEAGLLVLVVTAALSIADGGEPAAGLQLPLPLVGNLELTTQLALIIAAGAGLVMLALHIHVAQLNARLSAGVLREARHRIVRAYSGASWARQAEDREGALQEAVSTLSIQTSLLVMHVANLLAALLGLASLLTVAMFVDPVVTLGVLGLGGMLFFVLRPVGRLTNRRSRDFVKRNSEFAEATSEWGGLAMEFRVFGVADAQAERLIGRSNEVSDALARTRFTSRMGAELYRDLAVLFLVGAVAILHTADDVELAGVGAVVLLIVRGLAYAQMTNYALQQVREQSPNLEAMLERIRSLEAAAAPGGSKTVKTLGLIEIDSVSYEYEHGRPGVKNVSLTIQPGEVVGIVGPSGGGKSTLVQLLLRLRTPTSGIIRVSGLPYEEICTSNWNQLVAMVPQDSRLFRGSVAENISFLRPEVTTDVVVAAARAAHVFEDINLLPERFDTQLGPRGAGLSGGQRQRVAIARALAGQAPLLILDEPTSALDVRSEQLLQRTIEELRGDVTMVIVAHRLTTLASCDRVVAMANGRVKAVGSLDEVLPHVNLDEELVPAAPSDGET